ncbi:MAG: DUF4038 domain-containing protein [Acidobacteriales bacterium]|nr:DUF4038 domain-containing protein [Terriglobales bacterium]
MRSGTACQAYNGWLGSHIARPRLHGSGEQSNRKQKQIVLRAAHFKTAAPADISRRLEGGYKFGAQGGTPKDDQYVRSAIYGNVLSGGLAGHVYGAEGIWGADIEPSAPTHMWDAFKWPSAAQMQYLSRFILSLGKKYQELVPDQFVVPSQTDVLKGYEGWVRLST